MVQGATGECHPAANATDLDDRPTDPTRFRIYLSENPDCLSRQAQSGPEVRLHLTSHLLVGQGFGVAVQGVAGVVDENVNPAEPFKGGLESGRPSALRGHVKRQLQDRRRVLEVAQSLDLTSGCHEAMALGCDIFADVGPDA